MYAIIYYNVDNVVKHFLVVVLETMYERCVGYKPIKTRTYAEKRAKIAEKPQLGK